MQSADFFSALKPDEQSQINSICNEFESQWKGEAPPSLSEFADRMEAGPLRAVLLRMLLRVELELRRANGESPALSAYEAQLPGWSDLLREEWERASQDTSLRGLASTLSLGPREKSQRNSSRELPASIGEYEILGEIARGGMGIVYKGRHRRLGRLAAIKRILSGEHADEEEIRRFEAEAEAAAGLDHPHIVPVYDIGYEGIGREGKQHFIALAYVEGASLASRIKESPLDPHEAARLMLPICDAMQYAHERGIIHRDLKPHNILISLEGQPRVTDFGLAKRQAGNASLTMTGIVLGTPSYMPPEQAAGRHDEVGPLADVYSLGAILYELITKRAPFLAASPAETLHQVLVDDPVAPRAINSAIPVDLETICLKCLAKEKSQRYASASSLAADLRRFLNGEPIEARPVGWMERAWKWCRREPWIAGTGTAAAMLLVAVAVVSVVAYVRESDYSESLTKALGAQTRLTDQNAKLAEEMQLEAAKSVLDSSSAEQQMERFDLAEASSLKAWGMLPPANSLEPSYRQVAWAIATRQGRQVFPPFSLSRQGAVAFSNDGRRLATSTPDERILRLWDASTGKCLAESAPYHKELRHIVFSPDGKWILAECVPDVACIWNAETLEFRLEVTHLSQTRARISQDSQVLGVVMDGRVRLWKIEDGKMIGETEVHAGGVTDLAFSADSQILLSADSEIAIRASSMVDGKQEGESHSMVTTASLASRSGAKVLLNRDGTFGLTVVDQKGQFWDLATNQPVGDSFLCLSALQDYPNDSGVCLCMIGDKRWEPRQFRTGTVPRQLVVEEDVVRMAASSDGKRIAAISRSGAIRILPLDDGEGSFTFQAQRPSEVRFSPDGARLAVAGEDGIRVWVAQPGDPRGVEWTQELEFGTDGRQVLVASDSEAAVWDIVADQPVASLRLDDFKPGSYPILAAYGSSGPRRAVLCTDRTENPIPCIQIWDVLTGEKKQVALDQGQPLTSVGFRRDVEPISSTETAATLSSDGKRLVLPVKNRVRIYSVESGKLLCDLVKPGVVSARLSNDGKLLAMESLDRTDEAQFKSELTLWSVESQKEVGIPVTVPSPIRWAAGGDGRYWLTYSLREMKIWDVASGKELDATFLQRGEEIPAGAAIFAEFSPSGEQLAQVVGPDVRIFDVRSAKQVGQTMTHRSDVMALRFLDDDQLMTHARPNRGASSSSAELRVWNVRTGKLLTVPVPVRGLDARLDRSGNTMFFRSGMRRGLIHELGRALPSQTEFENAFCIWTGKGMAGRHVGEMKKADWIKKRCEKPSALSQLPGPRNPYPLWKMLGSIGNPKDSLAYNPGDKPYPKATASHTSPWDQADRAIDGQINFLAEPNNRWTSYLSESATDWLQIDFGEVKSVGRVEIGIYDDGTGVTPPQKWWVEYLADEEWKQAEHASHVPGTPKGAAFNRARFSPVRARKIRVLFEHNGSGRSGITELLAWPH